MKRRKKSRRSRKSIIGGIVFAVILILLAAAVHKADGAVRPVAQMRAEHFAESSASEIIGSAVAEYLDENRFTYGDFAAVLYDENGNAMSVEAMPYCINKVQSELTIRVNQALNSSDYRTERIPVGSLTRSYMLIGKGPELKLRICPSGSADVRLTSSFDSAGVNQTCHRISAIVTARLQSSVPLYSFETEVSFEFLLAESIIVGDVPYMSRCAWKQL